MCNGEFPSFQLVKKLQTAESTIESLNAQLCELESSESLARSRDQHDNIVTGLQHKYESEIYDLKQRLDKANQENDTKVRGLEACWVFVCVSFMYCLREVEK